ncbi:MAG: putative metal-binding motif-containing protein [Myxococcota bacterium]
MINRAWICVCALGLLFSGCQESHDLGGGSFAVTRCSPAGHCSAGGRCAAGYCLEECMADSDCSAGTVCQDGLCIASSGGMCAADADCPMGEVCLMGVCAATPPPAGCMADSDCPAASFCNGGVCTSICRAESCNMADDDCDGAIDEYCAGGGGMCADDADCPMGEKCLGGRCGSGPVYCMADANCAPGQVCVGGVCQTGGMCTPGPERCNMIDDDCDGIIDEACGGVACMTDAECRPGESCVRNVCTAGMGIDADGDGFFAGMDCDDADPTVFPGARELCDMRDNDCNGMIDDGCGSACMVDADCRRGETCVMNVCTPGGMGSDRDGDGFPAGVDCDDADPSVFPGARELCDGRDNDCNGVIDDGCGGSCMVDADCPMGQACLMNVCSSTGMGTDADGDGFVAGLDCDDFNATVFPGAPELCDMLDNDCNGAIDDGCGGMCIPSPEICNMVDDDCDGVIDNGCGGASCMSHADCPMGLYCVAGACTSGMGSDADGDGFPASSDCDDTNPAIHPGARERCNMLDDNCNGVIDEMCI